MRLIVAFLSLVRWPNLVFIALTQILFYWAVYVPLYGNAVWQQLAWIVAASVFIAAGGYIINDYFDRDIDRINKPHKNVLNTVINRRWAIVWHLSLSAAGILCTAFATSFDKWYLVLANVACVILLWLYSTSLKKKLLIGNIAISVLTAWTVLILFYLKVPFSAAVNSDEITSKYFRIAFLYGGFAFVIALIREAIKDVEDMVGDSRYNCRTLPIVVGVRATKIYIAVWAVVLAAALIVLQLYVLQFGWWWAVVYSVFAVILPLLQLFRKLLQATTTAHFRNMSALAKWIMLAGILSIIFFKVYV